MAEDKLSKESRIEIMEFIISTCSSICSSFLSCISCGPELPAKFVLKVPVCTELLSFAATAKHKTICSNNNIASNQVNDNPRSVSHKIRD